MRRRLLLGVALAAMWVALWGDAGTGTIVAGALAGLGVALITPTPPTDRHLVVRPVAAVAYVLTFTWQLLASTVFIARLVLSSRAAEAHGVLIEVELSRVAYPVRTLIAHSISLTPGTLTVDVDEDGRTLSVHVIDAAAIPDARKSIAMLERRACAAFSPLHGRDVADPEVEEAR